MNTLPQGTDTVQQNAATCPDGVTWCLGASVDHANPRERVHRGRAHGLDGSYGKGLLAFNLERFGDQPAAISLESGGAFLELDCAHVDQLLVDIPAHLDALRQTRAQLAAVADPDPGETWTLSVKGGGTFTGYLPAWADENPTESDVPAEDLSFKLKDIMHSRCIQGVPLNVHTPSCCADVAGVYGESLFSGHLSVTPHSVDPGEHLPTVSLQLVDDHWLQDLGPDELADVITKLRQQVDRLADVHAHLIQARADWATHAAGGQQ